MELVEREQQYHEIVNAWNRVKAGQGRIVLISGEAGIGKTSIIEHFISEQGRAAVILMGACDALFSPQPLGPLIEIAIQLIPDQHQQILSEADRLSFSTNLYRYLQKSAKPVILVVEDLHWADEATIDVIKFLGRRIQHTRTLLILSYRDDEIGSAHPLWFLFGDLQPNLTQRIQLPLLSPSAVDALAKKANRRLDALYRITGGNPFFVTEIIASQAEGIPSSVRDAVLARVVRLSPEARKIVELAAVVPGAVEDWLIRDLLHPDPAALDECDEYGILNLQGNTYVFRHDLARQSVEDSIPIGRARKLHESILAVLMGREKESFPLARIVHHAVGAGDEEVTIRFAPQAAQQASAVGAHREAIALYTIALRYQFRLAPEVQADLLEHLSFEYLMKDQIEDALKAREEATLIWEKLERWAKVGECKRWLSRLYWSRGDRKETLKYADQAIEICLKQPPGPELAMAFSHKSALHVVDWEIEPAVEWGNRALELAEELGAVEIWVHALTNIGSIEFLTDFYAGQEKIKRAMQMARDRNLDDQVARCYSNLGSSGVQFHRYSDARHWLEEGLEYTTARDIDTYSVYLRGWQAQLDFETGRWIEAEANALEALHLAREETITPIPALIALGHLKVRQGDPAAMGFLDRAKILSVPTGELQRIGPLAAARAEAAWWQGNLSQVAEEAAEAYSLALQRRDPWILGQLAFWMWRANERDLPVNRLAQPYAFMIQGDWHSAALAWEQLGCPFEQATALAEGDLPAKIQALSIFEQLGARPAMERLRKDFPNQGESEIITTIKPQKSEDSALLTPREVEILHLIAEGLSNPAMAERLTISIGTVKAHTASIYSKLGVNNRVQAVTRARELHLIEINL